MGSTERSILERMLVDCASIGKTNVSSQGQSANLQSLDLLPEVKAALRPYRLATNWVG